MSRQGNIGKLVKDGMKYEEGHSSSDEPDLTKGICSHIQTNGKWLTHSSICSISRKARQLKLC